MLRPVPLQFCCSLFSLKKHHQNYQPIKKQHVGILGDTTGDTRNTVKRKLYHCQFLNTSLLVLFLRLNTNHCKNTTHILIVFFKTDLNIFG